MGPGSSTVLSGPCLLRSTVEMANIIGKFYKKLLESIKVLTDYWICVVLFPVDWASKHCGVPALVDIAIASHIYTRFRSNDSF